MKILFTAEHDAKLRPQLEAMGDVKIDGWALGLPKMTEEELIAGAKDCEILIVSYDQVTKRVMENCPKLKLIICTRATPVNIDTAAAKELGIKVLYTPGRNSDTTAEMTIALMLSIARNVPQAHMALKQGKYTSPSTRDMTNKNGLRPDVMWDISPTDPYEVFKGVELHGKTLGIIGYGSIGRRVGHIARAFGMALLIYDPYVSDIDVEDVVTKKATLQELFKNSDFVTTHLKVTPETTGLIGKEQFALMKPTAYYLNTSRAAVVDESALIEALRNKQIAGAAVDVYESEPICIDHPFISELDNIVITPHIAGATRDVLTNHTKMIITEVERYRRGEPLLYEYK